MKNKTSTLAADILKTVLGAAVYAAGFQFFMYPNAVVTGGVTGIAMIINYLTSLPVGALTIVFNIPLFLFSWKKFGLRFILMSLLGTVLLSVFVDLFALLDVEVTHEPLLGAIYGGLIHGVGLGLVYRAGATTGGVDIVAKFLRLKYPFINFSTFILGLDAAVILAFALIFRRYDSAMYAVICLFISTKMIDLVLYGAVNSKVCYIITDESRRLKDGIMAELHRGVTFLHGTGAFSGRDKDVILCVIKQRQIVELRRLVEQTDPAAFMIVCDSREVFGQGFDYLLDEK